MARSRYFTDILRSVLFAVVFTLIYILLFALIVKMTEMESGPIGVVNQIAKYLMLLLGLFIGIKERERCMGKGLVTGLLYIIAATLLFSILSKETVFSVQNLISLLIGGGAGAVCGAIVALVKK